MNHSLSMFSGSGRACCLANSYIAADYHFYSYFLLLVVTQNYLVAWSIRAKGVDTARKLLR